MVAKAIDLKNVLMVYMGGAYDGCIEEMNWCLWDKDGKWHDVYSSGCTALNTEEKALEEYNWHKEHEDSTEYRDSSIKHIIDLNKKDDFKVLQSYETVMMEALLRSVNEKLAELGQEMVAWFECTKCEKKHYPFNEEPGYPESLKGNGGVGVVGDELLCPECNCSHSCTYCGEYDDETPNLGGYCSFCHEKALNHFFSTLDVGSLEWTKKEVEYLGKKEWVASGFEITSPEDFDRQWFEIEHADFVKPEKMDPEHEYLWVVKSNGVDYLIRARTPNEAAQDTILMLGTCDDVDPAWEAFTFDVDTEHNEARMEE
jgi:hypothetical protein